MSFMKSAASLKSKIRNANSAFSVLVCFGFEPPNKLSISYARYKVSRDTPLVYVNEYQLPVVCGNLNMIALIS